MKRPRHDDHGREHTAVSFRNALASSASESRASTMPRASSSPAPVVIPTKLGELHALIHWPDDGPGDDSPVAGVVLVDGSGDGTADGWGLLPSRLAAMGVVALTHDKPGCGKSPGHWSEQTLSDRAWETLGAVAVLRANLGHGVRVGLYGVSQGGWVGLIAANLSPDDIEFLVSVSGPGVSPAVQERARIERELRTKGMDDAAVIEALDWIDERTRLLTQGDDPSDVLARQHAFRFRPWYSVATYSFDDVVTLRFLAGILGFEPVPAIQTMPCPVFAAFGGADDSIPVRESAATFAAHLPALPGDPHALAIYPAADHGLYVSAPAVDVDRLSQLAPGFLTMVERFICAG